jgi:hypothetical protein
MNDNQFNLFSDLETINPLQGKRICLTGEFRMPQKELYSKLKKIGVAIIDRVSDTRVYKEGEAIPPIKESTNYFVVGKNPNDDSLKRYALNKHDGFHAKMIDEEKLYALLCGHFSSEDFVPDSVEKKLDLDICYYNWTPPVINGKSFISRVSSPLIFDEDGRHNPISQKEIYIPTIPGINMDNFYQIIGNLGGYANNKYYDDTNTILLSDITLKKLENGIKDEVIIDIENIYNKSNTKVFNIQFTSESDFITWVKRRMVVFPDTSTISYLKRYEEEKELCTI